MFNVFLVFSITKTIVSSTPVYFWVKQVFEKTLPGGMSNFPLPEGG